MSRKAGVLVVTLDEAAEVLLSTTSFIRREIRDGAIRAIRLGSKTVIRRDELKEYLQRKEAEGLPTRKPRKGKAAGVPVSDCEGREGHDLGDTSFGSEPEIMFEDSDDIRKETNNEDE